MTAPLRTALQSLLPSGSVLSPEEGAAWAGWMDPPAPVVLPGHEEEVARILDRAREEGWRVLPAGAGSWLDGGGTPEVDLVLSARRLSGIREYEPADLTFTAGAGVSLEELRRITGEEGQWFPLDPPGGAGGTLGGLVATGAWGPLRQLFGTARDQILGLTLVSGDGRILRWGGRVVKNVAGFDITRLCIGSWGTMGLLTSISGRLFPLPEADVTLLMRAPSANHLVAESRIMATSPLPLASVELLDPVGEEVGGGAALAIRLMGSGEEVREMEDRLRSDLRLGRVGVWEAGGRGGAAPPFRLVGQESRRFHDILEGWEEGASLVVRMSLLPSRLETLLEVARGLEDLPLPDPQRSGDTRPQRLAVHVGIGVLRLAVGPEMGEGDGREPWTEGLREARVRLEGMGGSLTVSQGPGPLLAEVGAWGTQGPEAEIMKGLKEQFDPEGILAAGRLGL